MEFSKKILRWYHKYKRDLPWRKTMDPYKIWISEIILQQTRVEQGTAYYLRFIESFPTISSLAAAPAQEVLKLWQGLGYYSRARNLHEAAKMVIRSHNGKVPDTYNDLLRLKGVGNYTAAAIASIAFAEPVAVIDGNVLRLLARYYNIHAPVNKQSTQKEISELANILIEKDAPGDFNQGMMELGALICTPKNPKCNLCPLSTECLALKEGTIDILPVKEKKASPQIRHFHFLYILQDDIIYIQKRNKKDIWQSLYEFPLIETGKARGKTLKAIQKLIDESYGPAFLTVKKEGAVFRHQLTHQTLHARFFVATPAKAFKPAPDWLAIAPERITDFPVSRLTDKFLSLQK